MSTFSLHVAKCIHCKKAHDVSATREQAANGRAMAKWTCPTTGKKSVTFIKGDAAPSAPAARKAPKAKATKAEAHERAAAAHEHEAARHEHEAAADARRASHTPTKRPHKARHTRTTEDTPMTRTTTRGTTASIPLKAHIDTDVDSMVGFHIAVGILEGLRIRGLGGAAALGIFSQADQLAREASGDVKKGADKREEWRDLGRDLAAYIGMAMAAGRFDGVTWAAMFPKDLADAYLASMTPEETADAAKTGILPESIARRSPDLSQALGYNEGQASVFSRFGTGLAAGFTGMKLGGRLGPYGALFGGILGTVGGVMAPEISETVDQALGTDKDPRDQRANDISGREDVVIDEAGNSVPVRIPGPGGPTSTYTVPIAPGTGPQLSLPTGR